MSCNPGDATIVAVGGYYMLKIMNKTDKGFGQIGTIKGDNLLVTSIAWLTGEALAAGTAETELIFVESGELKLKLRADEVERIDLSADTDGELSSSPDSDSSTKKDNHDVLCLTQFDTGFLYAIHNAVHVFEKTTNYIFTKKSIIRIPITLYDEQSYKIINVAVNAEQDTIVVATKHSQIYIGMLFVPETLKVSELVFRHLGEPLHVSGIVGLSVCSWKPILMTACKYNWSRSVECLLYKESMNFSQRSYHTPVELQQHESRVGQKVPDRNWSYRTASIRFLRRRRIHRSAAVDANSAR